MVKQTYPSWILNIEGVKGRRYGKGKFDPKWVYEVLGFNPETGEVKNNA